MTDTLSIDVTGIIVSPDVFNPNPNAFSASLITDKGEYVHGGLFIGESREEAVMRLKEHYTEGIRSGDPDLSLDDAFHIFLMQQKLKV